MMTILLSFELFKLVRKLENSLVGIEIALVLVLDALFSEYASYALHVFVRAPVYMKNLVLVVSELILRTADHAKIRGCLFSESDWYLVLNEHRVGGWVLHLFEYNTLLHLSDILLLHNTHQLCKLFVNQFGTELMVFGEALIHECVAALLRESGD